MVDINFWYWSDGRVSNNWDGVMSDDWDGVSDDWDSVNDNWNSVSDDWDSMVRDDRNGVMSDDWSGVVRDNWNSVNDDWNSVSDDWNSVSDNWDSSRVNNNWMHLCGSCRINLLHHISISYIHFLNGCLLLIFHFRVLFNLFLNFVIEHGNFIVFH